MGFISLRAKEEDEKERLSQVKDLHEEDEADNTEPLDDLFPGLSVEEVRARCNLTRPLGESPLLRHIIFSLSNGIFTFTLVLVLCF